MSPGGSGPAGPRRRFLRAAGAAGLAAAAGCAGRVREHLGGTGCVPVDGPPAAEAVTQFRGGLRRRGVYPEAEVPISVRVDWRLPGINTGERTASKASPVGLPGGDVLAAGDTGELRRVTPGGEVRWTAGTRRSVRGIHGTPAVANGAAYVGAYDGALYAFDLATGERHWRTRLADAIGSSPGYRDGAVLIAVEYDDPSGALFAVDAVTGAVRWAGRRPTDHPHSTAAVDRAADRTVVGANDGVLYAWDLARSFAWSFETGGAIKGPVATYDGGAFFGSWGRRVYRVGLAGGRAAWSFETGGKVMSGPAVEPATGTVYVGSHDGRLYALDAADGTERWAYDTGGLVVGCPTVTAGHVLVGSYDRHLHAVDKATGEPVWRVAAGGWVTSTPLVTGDAAYFAARASEDYLADGEGPTGALYRLVPD